jgi:hypothetical protein
MVAVDAWLLVKRVSYNQDVKSLRDHMSAAERERSDAIVQAEQNKLRIAIELAKRQAKFDKKLHLNVSVDSSRMYLTREGALLREMPVQFGPEQAPSSVRRSTPRFRAEAYGRGLGHEDHAGWRNADSVTPSATANERFNGDSARIATHQSRI